MRVLDASGKVVATFSQGVLTSTDPRTATWGQAVPATRAVPEPGGGIREEGTTIAAGDPRFVLALAEAIEDNGWRIDDDPSE